VTDRQTDRQSDRHRQNINITIAYFYRIGLKDQQSPLFLCLYERLRRRSGTAGPAARLHGVGVRRRR